MDPNARPLRFPPPRRTIARRALERLRGHTTAPTWLAEGLSPGLEELRAQLLRHQSKAAADIEALDALSRRHRREDREHQERLEAAFAAGSAKEPEDRRTPAQQREAERDAILERIEAGIVVMADVVEQAVRTLAEQEPAILAKLRGDLSSIQDARREAEPSWSSCAAASG
jgi:hypothetical protein